MTNTLMTFIKDEEGATAVEYGVMIALIIAVAVATITTLGTKVDNAFNAISTKIP